MGMNGGGIGRTEKNVTSEGIMLGGFGGNGGLGKGGTVEVGQDKDPEIGVIENWICQYLMGLIPTGGF